MFLVTDAAKQQLVETLRLYAPDPGQIVRLRLASDFPDQVHLMFDWQQSGDYVVRYHTGRKLMLVAPEVYPRVDGMVLDYADTVEQQGFVLAPLGSQGSGTQNRKQ